MKPAAGLLLGIVLVAGMIAATIAPRVSRSSMVSLEKLTDSKVVQLDSNTPAEALGPTRGVYLEGFGAVFTAEVDPNPYAAPNPFSRPRYSEYELEKLRSQKMARIETLKKRMAETLVVMARGLEGVPPGENVALAVTIPYYIWEKSKDMPRQIVVQAPKSALLNPASLEKALKVQEF